MTTVDSDGSRYLCGNYAPVLRETEVHDLPVRGKIPEALDGVFIRVGSNPQFRPAGPYHWFDGDGMLHGLRLVDGTVAYSNRWVRTRGFLAERHAGGALFGGFRWFPPEIPDLGPVKNPANTSVVRHAGKLFALCEVGLPYQIHTDLSTIGEYDFDGAVTGAMSAHPKIDPLTGEMCFFGYSPLQPQINYFTADPTGKVIDSRVVEIPVPIMAHDFAITESRIVFFDCPVVWDLAAPTRGDIALKWRPELGARLGVMSRDPAATDVRWFDIDPRFIVHTLNAYDDGDRVIVDAASFERMWLASDVPRESGTPAYLWRFECDLTTGRGTQTQLDDIGCDFPRLNDTLVGRRHRYGYMVGDWFEGLEGGTSPLLKFDLLKDTRETRTFGPGRAACEPVFVPRPEAKAEDDGWLLTLVYDHATARATLIVLDGQDFTGPEVATVELPTRVPFGFHGNWIPTRWTS